MRPRKIGSFSLDAAADTRRKGLACGNARGGGLSTWRGAQLAKLITLVCMGDSITFGQHLDPALRWASLIHAHYASRFADSDIHLQVVNRGISGETTRMGLERYPADVQ